MSIWSGLGWIIFPTTAFFLYRLLFGRSAGDIRNEKLSKMADEVTRNPMAAARVSSSLHEKTGEKRAITFGFVVWFLVLASEIYLT